MGKYFSMRLKQHIIVFSAIYAFFVLFPFFALFAFFIFITFFALVTFFALTFFGFGLALAGFVMLARILLLSSHQEEGVDTVDLGFVFFAIGHLP
jgi:hypothetical protein